MSPTNPTISSFDFIDEVVQKLANKKTFPNLTTIVIAGHSAGGQFATRYAMTSKVHDTPGVRSPTSWRIRPATPGRPRCVRFQRATPIPATPTRKRSAPRREGERELHLRPVRRHQGPELQQVAGRSRESYRLLGGCHDDQLIKQLVARPTTYLLGQVDVLPLGGFDSSPNAMAQGPTRRARGEAFFKYVTETLGAKHNAIIVPECGHNDRCIFTTNIVFPVIFPK